MVGGLTTLPNMLIAAKTGSETAEKFATLSKTYMQSDKPSDGAQASTIEALGSAKRTGSMRRSLNSLATSITVILSERQVLCYTNQLVQAVPFVLGDNGRNARSWPRPGHRAGHHHGVRKHPSHFDTAECPGRMRKTVASCRRSISGISNVGGTSERRCQSDQRSHLPRSDEAEFLERSTVRI